MFFVWTQKESLKGGADFLGERQMGLNKLIFHICPFHTPSHPTDAMVHIYIYANTAGTFCPLSPICSIWRWLPAMSMSMSINCCRDFPHHSETILRTQASCSFVSTIYSEDILSSSRYPIGSSDEEPSEDMWQNVKLMVTFLPLGLVYWQTCEAVE